MGVFVFFSGIALVIIGVILLIIARRMKLEQALKGDQTMSSEAVVLRA